ncbi:hypothetical protein [Nonomuraea sp. NPDC049709]|uniref:hypothetical protein n=1 Tax=Nonomuraea sp. NPDC049709 TaxID=3154736 RepID=UPI003440D926
MPNRPEPNQPVLDPEPERPVLDPEPERPVLDPEPDRVPSASGPRPTGAGPGTRSTGACSIRGGRGPTPGLAEEAGEGRLLGWPGGIGRAPEGHQGHPQGR